MRFTACVPRAPTPMEASRMRYIGATRNPCIGAPTAPPGRFSSACAAMWPAAIATTPIHAVPFRNSLLLFFMPKLYQIKSGQ